MDKNQILLRQAFDAYFARCLDSFGLTDADVAWYNITYRPDVTKLYVKPIIIFDSSEPASIGLDGTINYRGMYQVSIYGLYNTGVKQIEEMAADIMEKFSIGTQILHENLLIKLNSTYSSSWYDEDSRPIQPVTIHWNCFTNKLKPLEVLI